MFRRERDVRGRLWSGRAKANGARLPPRLRSLCEAAVVSNGDLHEVGEALGLGWSLLRQELSRLRSRGMARSARLFNPRALGRPFECITLVRVQQEGLGRVAEFEAWCLQDPTVTCALQVTGRYDYQLTTFHRDWREANRWRRVLEARPEVVGAHQRPVRTWLGDQVSGLVLREGPGHRPGSRG